MEPIDVYTPGTRCVIVNGRIPGLITEVGIHIGGWITYQVAWMNSGARISAWMEEVEIEVGTDSPRLTVGFY